jgi:alkanesulfonate monooxygenase SsuD/methylene tetrahydromethanopterin reductase-like flavin-dependent oxidoreductase (luciferase family)
MDFGIGPFAFALPSEYDVNEPGLFEQAVEVRPDLFCGAVEEIDRVSREELFGEALSLATRAEQVGFDSAWTPEHHFTRDGWLTSPLPVASALAARTDSLEIGTAIALAPLYEPMRVAEDAATISLLNRADGDEGSFTLGLALGFVDEELRGFGVSRDERVDRMEDVIDTCREAWSDGPITPRGRTTDYSDVTVTPKPAPETKIISGGFSRPALERCARKADGFIAPQTKMVGDIADSLDVIRPVLEEQGRDPESFDLYMLRYGLPHEDGADAAWETIKDGYLFDQIRHLDWVNDSKDVDPTCPDAEALFEDWDQLLEKWRDWTICGTPEYWISELEKYDEAWEGDVHVISQFHYPGMSLEEAETAVDLFGNEIIPAFEGS